MKHNEQSQQTKQELSAALKKQMESRPLNRITIRELVEACGVNRKTFYYHFEDIYDLLRWTLEQEALSHFEQYDLILDNKSAVEFVMDYISENLSMLQNIVRSIGRSELARFFYKDTYQSVYMLVCEVEKLHGLSVEEGYKAFLSRFLAEATAGILLECIERDTLDSRQKLTEYITCTLSSTIPNALKSAAQREQKDPRPSVQPQ